MELRFLIAELSVRGMVENMRELMRDREPVELALFDQLSATVREAADVLGADSEDAQFILGWYSAVDCLRSVLHGRGHLDEEDFVLVVMAGLSGRLIDGDGSSGT